jgi:small subunit ribosomal protein S16
MLKIRLQRVGRKHEPTFRLVLTDSENATKSGRYKEMLGSFDARKGESAVYNKERISHWLSKGAKPTETVHNLFIDQKIISGKKINKLPLKKAIKKDIKVENEAPATEPEKEKVSEEPKAEVVKPDTEVTA